MGVPSLYEEVPRLPGAPILQPSGVRCYVHDATIQSCAAGAVFRTPLSVKRRRLTMMDGGTAAWRWIHVRLPCTKSAAHGGAAPL